MKPISAALLLTCATVCAEDPDIADARLAGAAAQTCFRIISANYDDCVAASRDMDEAVQALVSQPSAASLKAARQAWVNARQV